ncbi:MAG: RrF2 family transcriptional regulator [Chitinispirillaceae bacterium]
MKLSTKCRYGARALVEIALHFGDTPAKRKDIAAIQGLSDSYLENILITLKTAGIIETVRGAKGGYILARLPERITLFDIVTALEGSLSLVDCLDKPDSCSKIDTCVTRDVWRRVQEAEEEVLRNTTLRDLMDKRNRVPEIDYVI